MAESWKVFYVQKKGEQLLPDPGYLHLLMQNAEYIDEEALTFKKDTLLY